MAMLVVCLCWLGMGIAADPDFSTVADILNGRRHLLRTDDVVWALTFTTPPSGSSVRVPVVTTIAPTQNSGFPGGGALLEPLESTGVNTNTDNVGTSTATAVGRMFNVPYDVVAMVGTLAGGETSPPQLSLTVIDPPTQSWQPSVSLSLPVSHAGFDSRLVLNLTFALMADFTGDGYADLVIASTDDSGNSGMVILTAVDVNNASAGLRPGPILTFSAGAEVSSVTVGDFNGDGLSEIAALMGDIGQTVAFLTVDPTTLQIAHPMTLTLPSGLGVPTGALAAGRFRDKTHDDLMAVGDLGSGPDTNTLTVYSISLDTPQQPQVVQTTPLSTSKAGTILWVKARTGRLDWFNAADQLVLGVATNDQGTAIIGTFDQDLNMIQYGPTTVTGGKGCLYDLAVGNFDQQNADGTRNYNLQLAILWSPGQSCGGFPFSDFPATTMNVTTWSVSPESDFSLTGVEATLVVPSVPEGGVDASNSQTLAFGFAVGDTQGRSVLVGPPEKVTIVKSIQPDIVLGIPPMHVDYIRDISNLPDGTPGVLNLTVKPSVPAPGTAFNTQFSFSSSDSTSATRKSTTSWGLSVKVTNKESASFGIPDVGSVGASITTSAGFTHDGSVAKQYNTYTGQTDSLSATTGFADHLFYSSKTQNIYYYPVLGQMTCPAEQPDCPENERLPLYVQFSGPDVVSLHDGDATTQEWYQPVHEPGNVFSYPWDETQLQLALPTTWVPLTTSQSTGGSTPWRETDKSTTAYQVNWNANSGSSQTSGSTNAESFSLSISTSGSIGVSGLGTNFSNTYDLNQSASVSTLNTTTQTLAAATGIRVNKPDFEEVADHYAYSFAGFVFGLKSPAATLQTIDLVDQQGDPIDIQSTGPLLVGFLADPLQNLPAWWRQAYALPDVGLHHPTRWDWSTSTQVATFNCADGSNSTTCTTATTDDPILTDFYFSKGFFVTPADANGRGPNRSVATAGDQLMLTVRVYNYSLVDTNKASTPAASIRVRFYGQLYDNSGGNLQGSSFLIGENEIGFITGFESPNTGPGGANWTITSVPFDTSGTNCGGQSCAGQYVVFWVVVWMEDGQGNLVPEIEGHGLTANPGAMTLTQITDVPIEAYSNNVGLYGYATPLIILPPPSTLGPTLAALAPAPGSLTIGPISVPPGPLLLDHKIRLSAPLSTDETRSGPVLVAYYDGDPQRGGKVFDVHHISHVAAHDTYLSRAVLRPQTCGEHTIVAVAEPVSAAPATAKTTVQVTIIPEDLVAALIRTTAGLDLPQGPERRLLASLRLAQKAFAQGQPRAGATLLKTFIGEVEAQRGKTLTDQQADQLIGQTKVVLDCV